MQILGNASPKRVVFPPSLPVDETDLQYLVVDRVYLTFKEKKNEMLISISGVFTAFRSFCQSLIIKHVYWNNKFS